MDAFWLAAVCFADDIILVSRSKSDLETMISEVVGAFAEAGLDVSPRKCHWTSKPMDAGGSLEIGGEAIAWERDLVFVGGKLDLNGNDGGAMAHRLAQGNKAFHKWQPHLQCKHASLRRRLELLVSTVFSSSLWLGETWLPTRHQQRHLDSWGARLVARMACVKRNAGEELGQYWRRLHRFGHGLLQLNGGSLGVRRLTALHGYAGHLARSVGTIGSALRTRCLSWWRFHQANHSSKWDGLRPKRFKVWRWESQLVRHYGEATSELVSDNVGWMLQAQEREAWRSARAAFAGE